MIFPTEIPPTAGLPAYLSDFIPHRGYFGGKRRLTDILAQDFALPPLQLECSGTACLIIALKTLQAMAQSADRNEVVIPAYNCPLVVLAIAWCGLKPRLCDIEENGFDFDKTALRDCISAKTLAIMPTHLGGQAADVAALVPLARAVGAFILEDAAQSFGVPSNAAVGTYGDCVFFSLAVGKGLTLYEGGIVTAGSAAMRAALAATAERLIASHPLLEAKRLAELFGYACLYRPHFLPWIYGLPRRRALARGLREKAVGDIFSPAIPLHKVSDIRAACGIAAAKRLPHFLRELREQARRRLPILQKIAVTGGGKFHVIGAESGADAFSWPFFMLLFRNKQLRDKVLAEAWSGSDGVNCLFIRSLAGYAYLRPYLGEQMPTVRADNFAERMLTVSNSLWFGNSRFEKLCHIIEQALLTQEDNHDDLPV